MKKWFAKQHVSIRVAIIGAAGGCVAAMIGGIAEITPKGGLPKPAAAVTAPPTSSHTAESIEIKNNSAPVQSTLEGDNIINMAPQPREEAEGAQKAYVDQAESQDGRRSMLYFPGRVRDTEAVAKAASQHLRAGSWAEARTQYNQAAFQLTALNDDISSPSAWIRAAWDEVARVPVDRLHGRAPSLRTYLQVLGAAHTLGEAELAMSFFGDPRLQETIEGSGISGLFAAINMNPALLWAFPGECASMFQSLMSATGTSQSDKDASVEMRAMVAALRSDVAAAESLVRSVQDLRKRLDAAAAAAVVLSKIGRPQDAFKFAAIASGLPKGVGESAREYHVNAMRSGDSTDREIQASADRVQIEREHEAMVAVGRLWAKIGQHEQAERVAAAARELRTSKAFDDMAVRQMLSLEKMIAHDIVEHDMERGNLEVIPRERVADAIGPSLAVRIVKLFAESGRLGEAEEMVASQGLKDTQWDRPRTRALLHIAEVYNRQHRPAEAARLWKEAIDGQVPLSDGELMPVGYSDRVLDLMIETSGLLYDAGLIGEAESWEQRSLERYNARAAMPRDGRQKEDRKIFGFLAPYFFGDDRVGPSELPRVLELDRQRTAAWVHAGLWPRVDSMLLVASDPTRPIPMTGTRLGVADGLHRRAEGDRHAAGSK